jgi:hypothetical protein
MDESLLRAHVRAIDDCNQRGGRMLSLVDLIAAGTVDLPLAAYLSAAMRSGASLLVGARPGGAGKTTVMCALLNFLPDDTILRPVGSRTAPEAGQQDAHPARTVHLAHEIGRGPYYAYVWGEEARAFFRLAAQGHLIASNLHADTLEETRDQLCGKNGVPETHLNAVTLKVYLRVERTGEGRMRRWVRSVYESDGVRDRLLWTRDERGAFIRRESVDSVLVSPELVKEYAEFLTTLLRRNLCHIEDVRRALVQGIGEGKGT